MASRRDYSERDRTRFWSFVARCGAVTDACWNWTGATRGRGGTYGAFVHGGSTFRAHRIAWEVERGPIPEGSSVLHVCDNPLCCNPLHLFLGTQHDNMQDRRKKGRWAGERPWKLTAEQRAEVLRAHDAGEGATALAQRFDVSRGSIQYVVGQTKSGVRRG